ncbi:hypothetical protein Osc7112_3583 [Oscillatoria nigro-viridis PCC 7112]|uniref:Uncharacterized protein n=1 Tax=Phormidium nigroviride PCC 7112 TaxID=179408 RepID=K9VKC0_9CYAN|nr:hypothetical protein Osc7112_3583 [Oscillatoria nigro-viridis PCC 7112]
MVPATRFIRGINPKPTIENPCIPRIYLAQVNPKSTIENLKSNDPAQKRRQVSDNRRGGQKFLDLSSTSQIHGAASKSKI